MVDVDLIRATWGRAIAHGDAVPAAFYARLFLTAPGLRDMFPAAMDHQRDRLVGALAAAVANVDQPDTLIPYLRSLGVDHRKFGVVPAHFPLVGEALIATVAAFTGPEHWTPEAETAWRDAYATITKVMVDAAADAAQVGIPPHWDAEVLGHRRATVDLAEITVAPAQPLPYLPGQSMPAETAYRPRVWRQITPVHAPRPDHRITFHMRVVRAGEASGAFVHRLRPGDTIRLGPAAGAAYVVPTPLDGPLLMLAGGTGLSPFLAVLDGLVRAGNRAPVTLIYGMRSGRDHRTYPPPLAAWLDWARGQGSDWLRLFPCAVDDPEEGQRHGDPLAQALAGTGSLQHHRVMVCGPPALIDAARRRLPAAGVPPEQIHAEEPADPTVYRPTIPREARVA